MRLVPVSSLEPGQRLGQDLYVPGAAGPPLLRAGVVLDARYVRALRGKGIASVFVEDALSEGVIPNRVLRVETRQQAIQAVGSALGDAGEALISGRGLSSQAVEELQVVADLIAREVDAAPDVALHLADMMGAERYLLQHVVDVAALGTVLAGRVFRLNGWLDHTGRRRRDKIDPRLAKIALGLLLHDIGKLSIPQSILDKPGALDASEWAIVRKHPEIGAGMLGENISFLIRAVVRQHHERWDGSGYPDRLEGEAIHQFARIAAVADVYDAVTSERVYRKQIAPHQGVALIERGEGTEFDPEVVAVFGRVVLPFPPGSEVELADGRTALVVAADPAAPYEPTVRVQDPVTGRVEELERALLAVPVTA